MALPLTRMRGPGIRPLSMALRTDGVRRTGALGSHVALGGEARHQIVPGRQGRQDGPLRLGFLDGLQILGAGMQEKMHMRVDQARHQGGVAKIDHFGARGMLHAAADGGDALAFDQDFAGADDLAGFHVQQPRGVKDDRMRRALWHGRSLRQRRRRRKKVRQRQTATEPQTFMLRIPLVQTRPQIDFIPSRDGK